MILVLHNVRMVPSYVRKNKGTSECNKSIVTYDIGIAQCENDTIKCEKKNKRTTECNKSTITCDVGNIQCERKNKKTTKCDKSIVTCNVGTKQCEDDTIKCEKKK